MKAFAKQYAAAVTVTEKRSLTPVLACVFLDADKRTMTFTDMDIALTLRDVPVTGKGVGLFDAHMLNGILRKPGLKSVMLEGDTLAVKSDYTYKLKSNFDPADFPSMEYKGDVNLSTVLNSRIFTAVNYAVYTDETRYYLNGVYLHPSEGKIKSCATDGHRLCLHDTGLPIENFPGVIIPRKTASLVPKLMDEFEIETKDARAKFTAGNVEIVSKLIDGTFPDYGRVIPSRENAATLKTDWKKLGKFCADNKGKGGVKMTAAGGSVNLEISLEPGAVVAVNIKSTITGEIAEIGFNASYAADMVRNLGCDCDTTGYFNDSTAPATFISGSELHVFMPMRV